MPTVTRITTKVRIKKRRIEKISRVIELRLQRIWFRHKTLAKEPPDALIFLFSSPAKRINHSLLSL
jgi:hypothetical protein